MARKYEFTSDSVLTVKGRGTFRKGDNITGDMMDSILRASETFGVHFTEIKGAQKGTGKEKEEKAK